MYSEERLKLLEQFTESTETTVPPPLVEIIHHISQFGVTCYPWPGVRHILYCLLRESVFGFHKSSGDSHDEEVQQRCARINTSLLVMPEPPFTLQRTCEIVLSPEKYYSQTPKLLNALEKLVRVQVPTPTLEPAEYNQTVLAGLENAQEAQEFRREDEERRQRIEAQRQEEAGGVTMMTTAPEDEEAMGEGEERMNDALLAAADEAGSEMEVAEESMDVE